MAVPAAYRTATTMTTSVTAAEPRAEACSRATLAKITLERAAASWFVVAALGQWMFVYFILAFYAVPTLGGRFEAWSRNDELISGYIAGDRSGNLVFAVHVLLAALITTSGIVQNVPQIRSRALAFHRCNGRLYVLVSFVMALGGVWMIWVRGTRLTLAGGVSSTIMASLIAIFAGLTVRTARAHRISAHRRWALRLFLVANGVWFQRIGYLFWFIAAGGAGIGKHMDGPFDVLWGFGDFVVPLAVLEVYLRTKEQGSPLRRSLVAGVLFAMAAATGIGIVGTYVFMWRPILQR